MAVTEGGMAREKKLSLSTCSKMWWTVLLPMSTIILPPTLMSLCRDPRGELSTATLQREEEGGTFHTTTVTA